jgi:hypothetical protein
MKKQYIIPTCTAISLRTPQLLTASENDYWSDGGVDQGLIHFEDNEVDAEDGD